MKNTIKKALSVMLVVIIFATSLPFNALAKDDTTQNNQNISTDMGDMSFTATNSFGEMLTDSLSEYTGEQNGEYYISDIEYEGYCALVTFATQQGCTIMVAAYEEDTGRMITSASVDVFAEDTEAFVEFEDELPDYFVLKAYMLDDNAAPLCKAYTCNEMTQAYEDFAATTIDDYDEDKVINLDEDETTNFLVMSDETTTITNDGKTNVLVSYDEETGVYTFDNIDEQITSLRKDDIFYFDNGNVEELTFIKVGTVDIDGTTAYITEAEASIEEVFDVVKLDNEMTSGEFSLNEDEELEDGVTYLGCEEVEEPRDEVSTFGWGDETSVTFNHVFKIEKDIEPETTVKIKKVDLTGSIKFTGTVGVTVVGTFKFYISDKFSEIEFTLTPSVGLNVKIEGVGRLEIKLKSFDISPCAGVFVGITPKIVAEITGTVSFDARLKFTLGIGYNSDDGLVNKSEKPNFKPEIKVEGEIFIGVDLAPYVSVVSKKLVQLQLGTEIGAKLTSTMSSIQDEAHLCEECLDGRIDLVGEITGKFILGEDTKFEKELSVNFVNLKIKIADFYYSFTMDDFGWLDYCPNSLVVRGKCGKNLEWAYNHQTETLTITGKGKMFDYENDNVPWFDYRFDGIKKIVIGNSVTTIGEYAFYFCGELTAVEIGKGLTEIGDNAFGDCDNLTDVYYSGTKDEWNEIKIGENNDGLNNATYYFDESVIVNGTCGENLTWTFDDSTGTLTISGTGEMNGFNGNRHWSSASDNPPWENYKHDIKTIYIERGVTTIGSCAFERCESLTSITIPDSVTIIGFSAFEFCDNLTNITIPDSVTTICGYAFSNCDSLRSVAIPDSVTTLGDFAFCYCDRLSSIVVDSNNQYYSSDEYGVLFNKDKTTLIQYPIGNTRTSYVIPDGVTTIDDWAFCECYNLTSVTIGDGVTTICGYAFSNCSSLTSVTIGDSVTTIGDCVFRTCFSLTSVTIPDSVTTIGDEAFCYCDSLTSVTIPDSVTTIGDEAFGCCYSLTNITVDSNNQYYSNDEYGVLFNKDKTTLTQYPVGNTRTNYIIPDSVTTIGNYAFYYCDSLTSVTIPDSVTTIGDRAFAFCGSLTSVTIPDSVTTIGNYAFYYCDSLTSVTIPDSVTTIGDWAFCDCDSLTSVYYSGSESQWNEIFIGDYNNALLNATIHYNSTGATYSSRTKQPKMMSFAMAKSNALTVYNATASNAILGNEYVIVVLNDTADINDFTNNDLLYIDQKTAEADGDITFNYVPKTDDDCIVYIIGIFSDTNSVKQELITPTNSNEPENPDYNFNFHIQQPSRTTIRNKDTIILHAIIDGTVPEGSYIEWDTSEGNFSLGWELDTEDTEVYATAEDKGYDTITAILYDADGNELARDNVELYSKSGFFDKIGGFFRMLFGATKTYYN